MIVGNRINLRLVELSDAEFILSLRVDKELNKLSFDSENISGCGKFKVEKNILIEII